MPLNKVPPTMPPPPPPPCCNIFLPLHLYLKVISAMRRPFQAIYVGIRRLPSPPSRRAGPLTPPQTPTLKVARKREAQNRRMARCCATPPPWRGCFTVVHLHKHPELQEGMLLNVFPAWHSTLTHKTAVPHSSSDSDQRKQVTQKTLHCMTLLPHGNQPAFINIE